MYLVVGGLASLHEASGSHHGHGIPVDSNPSIGGSVATRKWQLIPSDIRGSDLARYRP